MASLEARNGSFRIVFMYRRERHSLHLGEVDQVEAAGRKGKVEELLRLINRNLLTVPPGMPITTFLAHDGRPPDSHREAKKEPVSLAKLRDDYLAVHRSSLEPNTVQTIELHFRHLAGHLGEKFQIGELGLADLQGYVQAREKHVEAGTIKAELISLRTAWNWGERFKLVEGRFPNKGIRYPRSREKLPFMTVAEAERRLTQGGKAEDVWECVYLTTSELPGLLGTIREKAIQPWVYPMAVVAAHTGMRRSELIRAELGDVDFTDRVLTVREKKRRKGMDTSRRVPMSSLVIDVLSAWVAERPEGCSALFWQGAKVERSKKKRTGATPITPDEAHNHMERALAGGKWENLRGWHVFRHSFISALASQGVDQRFIDEFVGHTTDEMRRRYRHLWPEQRREAITRVFG